MAADKLFKSDDMGNTWTEISGDLTRDENRNQFKVMGKYWPASAVAKDVSTSQWGTVVSLAESPLKQGLLFVGTDDGVIQVSNDDGKTWTKTTSFPGVPEYTYVSDIFPSNFDENVVFATFNNTKSDDFKPYVLKSTDQGKTWTSLSSNLPENGSVHTIAQDPVKKNLLFAGTEFSFFFSEDGGKIWVKLANGLPSIPVRDIAIQKSWQDIAIATFGRGFYILDDYIPLRDISAKTLKDTTGIIFPVRDALMYIQKGDRYGTGSAVYQAPNPPFGATFTYYVKEVPKTLKEKRLKKEKELFKKGEPIPQPNKKELDTEKNETGPYLVFTVKDNSGATVRKLYKKASKGVNRITWNLKYKDTRPVSLKENKYDPMNDGGSRMLALPGTYTVDMNLYHNGKEKLLAGPVQFTAKVLNNTTLPDKDRKALVAFQDKVAELYRVISGAEKYYDKLVKQTAYIRQAIQQTNGTTLEMKNSAMKAKEDLEAVEYLFEGTPAKASAEEVPPEPVPLSQRLQDIVWGMWQSTSAPTSTMQMNYDILMQEAPTALDKLHAIGKQLDELNNELEKLKAPYTPGRIPKM